MKIAVVLLTLASGLPGYFLGRWLGRRKKPVALLSAALAILSIILYSFVILRPDWEVALFPFRPYLYLQRLFPVFPMFVFLGVTRERLPRKSTFRLTALFAGIVFSYYVFTAALYMRGVDPADFTERADRTGFCEQTTRTYPKNSAGSARSRRGSYARSDDECVSVVYVEEERRSRRSRRPEPARARSFRPPLCRSSSKYAIDITSSSLLDANKIPRAGASRYF